MRIEHVINGFKYTLSNTDLKVGNEVYPIGVGKILNDGSWLCTEFDFSMKYSGFPELSQIVKKFEKLPNQPKYVITNHSKYVREACFKIMQVEKVE